ncbi:response regulator [Gillisia sp. JM1]|uniref:tetratricopeptide repeat-containing hybrid sensor histidine kinase/response regulator n=1 Tax=Gillisia sp. JM1 TaxID=1283286 RepID=UPI000478DC03|nr:response regulator [Gillisia sp. JM1]
MKKNYFYLIIFLLAFANLYSQQSAYKDAHLESLRKLTSEHLDKYEYNESIEVAMQMLEESKKRGNDYYVYHSNNILGVNYGDLNDTLHSRKYYKEALKVALKLDNDTLLLMSYNNLGNVYSEDKNTTQIGIDYYNRTIDLATEMNFNSRLLEPTANIAWTYLDLGLYDKAFPYLNRTWKLMGDRDDNTTRAQLLTLMGRYYMGVNELEEAKSHLDEAIQIVERDTLILEASLAYKEYAQLLSKQGSYKEGFIALEKYEKFNSQIFERQRLSDITNANVKFDVIQYQKDLEIARKEQSYKDELIEKSQERMYVMVIASIILIVIIILVYRINLSRRTLNQELSLKNKELIAAKEEAERLTVLKTKFFSTISHELRTPLYGVIGLTSILMDDKSLSKHEEDLKSLKFSADYLLALINDVLQMNKMESNLLDLEPMPFNLNELLRSIVKSFEFTRLQNKNTIHLELCQEANSNLIGDKVRLSQILMNLVGNAMKFTERGDIWIKTKLIESSEKTAKIYFEIRDNGSGISKHNQELIFEEFSQLQSANYNYQGTGLGLPIVKKLLILFNSEINLMSKEGEGSTFSFEIEFENGKLSKEDFIQNIQDHDLSVESIMSSGEKRILVVDDNRINQVVTKRILEQQQFVVDLCDNGVDAIERVRNNHFELVLMDVNMPGISGLEATKRIREFNEDIPIIALTAMEIDEIREEIYESGVNDIIVKPYDTARFYQVIFKNLRSSILR